MIEFKLTDREQEILAQARAEAAVGRTYARYFDKHEDEYEPPRDVKLASETSPRDIARAHPDEISGYNIVDVLVAIEEAWGDIALRNTHRGIGSMILASGGSQELQDRYWLYLVDRERICEAEYEPEMIQNPHTHFIERSAEGWIREEQGYKFTAVS